MNLLDILRLLVIAALVVTALGVLGSWAARTMFIDPRGRLGETIRKLMNPMLAPIAQWQLQRGANPEHAGWWLLAIAAVSGILILAIAEVVVAQLMITVDGVRGGARGIVGLPVFYASQLLLLALLIRVVSTLFGVGRRTRWVRWTYTLTDWIVVPLRRIVPRLGKIDLSALVAWVLILIVSSLLLRWV